MKKIIYTLIPLMGLLFSHCTDFDCCSQSVVKVSKKIIVLADAGDTDDFTIASSVAWKMSGGVPTWVKINWTGYNASNPTGAPGATTITVEIIEDNNSADPRTATITFLTANGDKVVVKVQQEGDSYALFKADATPRWEKGATVEKNHLTKYTFINDKGGNLFDPTPTSNYKIGRITIDDGSAFEIIEFTSPMAAGVCSGNLVTPGLSTPLHKLQVVKIAGNKVWIVFYETASAQERRIVQ